MAFPTCQMKAVVDEHSVSVQNVVLILSLWIKSKDEGIKVHLHGTTFPTTVAHNTMTPSLRHEFLRVN